MLIGFTKSQTVEKIMVRYLSGHLFFN